MKLGDIIPDGCVFEDLKSTTKEAAITEMVEGLVAAGRIGDDSSKNVLKALMDREELGSTGIGSSVAVPHAKHESVSDLVCALGRSRAGIEFDALDGEPVHVAFLLLSSKGASGSHLEALAFISRLVRDERFVKYLRDAKDAEDLRAVLAEADQSLGNK